MVRSVEIRGFPHAYHLTPATSAPVALVFIHGWLLSQEYWTPVVQRLSADYQCLCYDLRGFGASQPMQDYVRQDVPAPVAVTSGGDRAGTSGDRSLLSYGHTPAAYAEDLHHLLHHLGIQRAWLVGHSLGGSIALWAADQSPTAIAGVICVNSGGGIYLKEEFERFRAAGQQLVKLRPRWLTQLPFLDLPFTRMNVSQPIDRQWGRQRLLDWVAAHPMAALGALLDSTTEEEVHCLPKVVARLTQPVYFLSGEKDKVMEPKYVNHLASFHPLFKCNGDNVMQVPDCGHLAMVERPEIVSRYIRQILEAHL